MINLPRFALVILALLTLACEGRKQQSGDDVPFTPVTPSNQDNGQNQGNDPITPGVQPGGTVPNDGANSQAGEGDPLESAEPSDSDDPAAGSSNTAQRSQTDINLEDGATIDFDWSGESFKGNTSWNLVPVP